MEGPHATGADPREQPAENCGVGDVRGMANAAGDDDVHRRQNGEACSLQSGGDACGAAEDLDEGIGGAWGGGGGVRPQEENADNAALQRTAS